MAFRGADLPDQPTDAHVFAATVELVGDPDEAARVPHSAEEFLDILQERHRRLMAAHPDLHPGAFKSVANRAGATTFVDPTMVTGTLIAGWETIDAQADPFARATQTMFVVSEVHPFDDGNGRVARIMANAELTAATQDRIIVPIVYRSEYLLALSALTNNARPDALSSVLHFAQRWTAQVDWTSRTTADRYLDLTNAMVDSSRADREGLSLRLPSGVPAHQRHVPDYPWD